MRTQLRKWWPVLKAVLAVAIIVAIGRRFSKDLQSNPELWTRPFRPAWLILSGLLYLLGLGMSALFWYRLLRNLGQFPTGRAAVRAYYLGHLGKYLPGKAWALFLRATLIRGKEVRVGVATYTSLFEVLTTMTSGVVLSSLYFVILAASRGAPVDWRILKSLLRAGAEVQPVEPNWTSVALLSLILLLVVGGPVLPSVFNRLVEKLSLPFRENPSRVPPKIPYFLLFEGLILTSMGWALLGASLWSTLRAIIDEPISFTPEHWAYFTAFMGLSYVCGFVILLVPSGLGIREFFLTLFLAPELSALVGASEARSTAVFSVLVLRLVWTAAELVIASIVFWLPRPASPHESEMQGTP